MDDTAPSPHPHPKPTYRTSLREIFTPTLDRFTMQPYQGNHRDLVVTFIRKGNLVTVEQYWGAAEAPGDFYHCLREEMRIDAISDVIRDFAATATNFTEVLIEDDLPEGFSYATAPNHTEPATETAA